MTKRSSFAFRDFPGKAIDRREGLAARGRRRSIRSSRNAGVGCEANGQTTQLPRLSSERSGSGQTDLASCAAPTL